MSRTRPTARTITTVRINSLEQTKRDPNINGDNVKVARKVAIKHGTCDGTRTKDKYLCGVGVLGSQAKRCRVLVVQLVNMLVQGSPMKCLVSCTQW